MSVLINMEMPTSEEKCKFFQPAPFRAPVCVINGVCHGIDNCPLKPIPPHGRLIDADAINYEDEIWKKKRIPPLMVYNAWLIAGKMPTIIPAEEDEG